MLEFGLYLALVNQQLSAQNGSVRVSPNHV